MKYFNDAILGNDEIVLSLNKKGKLLRLFYPSPDFRQFFKDIDVLFKINDNEIYDVNNDFTSVYKQYYVENTNIVKTEITNSKYNLKIVQTDFCMLNEAVMVRRYEFENLSDQNLNIRAIVHADAIANENVDTSGYFKNNCLIQYNHTAAATFFSNYPIDKYKVNNMNKDLSLNFENKEYIGLSSSSTMFLKPFDLKAGEKQEIDIYLHLNDNSKIGVLNELDNEINRIRKINVLDKENETKKHWEKYVKKHTKHDLKRLSPKAKEIYVRSLMLLDLLYNKKTGGVSVAVEVDEEKEKSGRYSFCWPRDAYYVIVAYDLLGMFDKAEKYFEDFCTLTQSRSGRWEQRFYTDGTLAPCWGYQIDETAIIPIGIYKHYQATKKKSFLKNNLRMVENAYTYLDKYVDSIIKGEKTDTFDLWEMYQGETIFGVASVYAAMESFLGIYNALYDGFSNNRLKQEQIRKKQEKCKINMVNLKSYIVDNFYNEEKNSFVRAKDDARIDISALSIVHMFNIFTPEDKKVTRTVENIDMYLRTYTGGYIRFENDTYMGGYNPWSLSSMWLACYYLELGEYEKALENFNFVVNTASELGFIPEQIDNETLKPKWVIGLTWAHGMYISLVDKMMNKGII